MLGKIVKVAIDHAKRGYVSKVGKSMYCGKIVDSIQNDLIDKSAYVMIRGDIGEIFEGVIIAVLNKNEIDKRCFIVAPRGLIYYEPEIRDMLSKVKNQPIHSLQCRYEKSCGAVVINGERENLRVLLVKNRNAAHWSFPKGHIEKGENEQQTAIREIWEETGLDVSIINGFRETSDYYSFGSAKKRVVFFLARSYTKRVTLQMEELSSYIWATYEQALKLFEFKNNITILKRAVSFINNRNGYYRGEKRVFKKFKN